MVQRSLGTFCGHRLHHKSPQQYMVHCIAHQPFSKKRFEKYFSGDNSFEMYFHYLYIIVKLKKYKWQATQIYSTTDSHKLSDSCADVTQTI